MYGVAPSVVDPQDTNCNLCSGLRQPGADTVRKTCDFWHFRAEKVHYQKVSGAKLIRRKALSFLILVAKTTRGGENRV